VQQRLAGGDRAYGVGQLVAAGVLEQEAAVGLAVPALFDSFQLVFMLWVVATSGWLLARGSRAAAEAPTAEPLPA
jgi:hypothetical protein